MAHADLTAKDEKTIGDDSELSTSVKAISRSSVTLESQIQRIEALPEQNNHEQPFEACVQNVEGALKNFQVSSEDETADTQSYLAKLAINANCTDKESWEVEEAMETLPVAFHYGMKHLTSKLTVVLEKALSDGTCIQMFQLAFECGLDNLLNASRDLICRNFIQVSADLEKFCNLSVEQICMLLNLDQLQASEEHVFSAIRGWIMSDLCNRRKHTPVLLSALRVNSCSLQFLKVIKGNFLVSGVEEFHSTIQKIVENPELSSQQPEREDWRFDASYPTHTPFYVMGGTGVSPRNSMEVLSYHNHSWARQKDFTQGPSDETLIVNIGPVIFVLEPVNKRFRSYDTKTKKWKDLKPMPALRTELCVAKDGTQIYAFGGNGHFTRCDLYDTLRDSWKEVASMKEPRTSASAANLQGIIYCAGGTHFGSLKSMEVYNPGSDMWSEVASMSIARFGHCLVTCGHYLWAVGGKTHLVELNDLEKYDSVLDVWIKMSPMPTKRCHLSVISQSQLGFFYAIGGCQNGKHLPTTETYDSRKDLWTKSSPLSCPRSNLGACAIYTSEIIDDYSRCTPY